MHFCRIFHFSALPASLLPHVFGEQYKKWNYDDKLDAIWNRDRERATLKYYAKDDLYKKATKFLSKKKGNAPWLGTLKENKKLINVDYL